MALHMRRIDCAAENAMESIEALRRLLSPDGEVVSEAGRALTQKVFGEPLSPARSVERICQDVRDRGFEAVQHFSRQFDRFELTSDNLRVSADEITAAHERADRSFLETIRRVRKNIWAFQTGILHRDAILRDADGQELHLRYRPVRRIGVCVPGGAAAYPSTLLMTVGPAQAAGVKEIAVVAPPTPFGANNPDVLAVCCELGVTEVYRLGGAQAVAALAYGIDGLPKVDMIVGPGNLFVALAKRYVFGHVGIDMLAGPTEVVVLADETANPAHIASDLISQAEHAPGASLLLTWHAPLIDSVSKELTKQLAKLPRGDQAKESLEKFGAFICTRNADEAIALANRIAPEHLHIQAREAEQLAERIENAGAVFIGPYTPVAVGDYVAGPSHVLPTGGTARFASGLSANDFLRRSSLIKFSDATLRRQAPDVKALAEKEGLTGHWQSVAVRLNEKHSK
jgi:histidinol dehydrogenase